LCRVSAVTLISTAVTSTEKFIPIRYLATSKVIITAVALSTYTHYSIVFFFALWACDSFLITTNNITIKDKINAV
jgi:hypothetical protein